MAFDENTAMHGRLDRLVPRLVLDWVTDEPERRWRIVEGTMVFADISGFTALSERLATRGRIGTEELVETLSRVFSGMLGITANRGGQLLKFGGDALLLLFTGPDHAQQAASAAVEMRQDLRRSAQIPTSVGKLKLAISIGVHSGAFHLFLVGEPYRQLVVVGPDTTDTMNAETAAEAGQIVVTRGHRRAARSRRHRAQGGRATPVALAQGHGSAHHARPVARHRLGRRTRGHPADHRHAARARRARPGAPDRNDGLLQVQGHRPTPRAGRP